MLLHVIELLESRYGLYEALDSAAVPSRNAKRRGAGVRQIVETGSDKGDHAFGLSRERPLDLTDLQARLAAKLALHNFCIGLNGQLRRPNRAFADLVDWQHGSISPQAFYILTRTWHQGMVAL